MSDQNLLQSRRWRRGAERAIAAGVPVPVELVLSALLDVGVPGDEEAIAARDWLDTVATAEVEAGGWLDDIMTPAVVGAPVAAWRPEPLPGGAGVEGLFTYPRRQESAMAMFIPTAPPPPAMALVPIAAVVKPPRLLPAPVSKGINVFSLVAGISGLIAVVFSFLPAFTFAAPAIAGLAGVMGLVGVMFRGYIKWFSFAGLGFALAAVGLQAYLMFLS